MHALHLPHASTWRLTALAALAAVVATMIVLLTASRLAADDGSTPPPAPAVPATHVTGKPAWVTSPLAPPTLEPRAHQGRPGDRAPRRLPRGAR
jgi:hypothetical protein